MNRLVTLPILTMLALTGCSYNPAGPSSSPTTAEESPSSNYSGVGLNPVLHQNLSSEENAFLDAATTQVLIDGKKIAVAATVTDSDGTSKNGDWVQEKHVRVALDTTEFFYTCDSEQYMALTAGDPETAPGTNGKPDCLDHVTISTSPSQGARDVRGIEMGIVGKVEHGRSVIETDAVTGNHVALVVNLGSSRSTRFDALTGEVLDDDAMKAARTPKDTFTPGLTQQQLEELASTKPQYTQGEYTMTVGKGSVAKKPDGTPVLQVPVITKLSGVPCNGTTQECHVLFFTTNNDGDRYRGSGFKYAKEIPRDFSGVITVESSDLDKATIGVYHESIDDPETKPGHKPKTTIIDLITGESKVVDLP